jgi:hypothetical protein
MTEQSGDPSAASIRQERVMRSRFGFRSLLGAAIAAVTLGTLVQPAGAVEISKHSSDSATVNAIQLNGKIDDGDTFELQVHISKLPKKPTIVIYLNSPGGNLREGMRLGKFFFENKIETVVETKTTCASACALAFLGGRDGDTGRPHRTKASNGGLGFHSFTREFDNKSYSADDLKTVVQMTQTQVFVVAEYLKSIGADLDILRLMLRAQANQMNYISNDEALALNIRVFDDKRNLLVDPAEVMERLDRSHAATSAIPAASATAKADGKSQS